MKQKAPKFHNPARYRLDFIKENTLMTLWSVRMTRSRVWIVSLASMAAILALLWVVVAFTPLRQLLPGALHGDLRAQYIDTALRLDSLEQAARLNDAYLANIIRIMEGSADTIPTTATAAIDIPDSLLAASDAERQFVRSYEDEERFNLSVLAPIAAEGMIFSQPTADGSSAVSAIYRGTVVGCSMNSLGLTTITIQHPNDFISVYEGLDEVFVKKGDKVAASQRLGHLPRGGALSFELWHKGSPLNPNDYLSL